MNNNGFQQQPNMNAPMNNGQMPQQGQPQMQRQPQQQAPAFKGRRLDDWGVANRATAVIDGTVTFSQIREKKMPRNAERLQNPQPDFELSLMDVQVDPNAQSDPTLVAYLNSIDQTNHGFRHIKSGDNAGKLAFYGRSVGKYPIRVFDTKSSTQNGINADQALPAELASGQQVKLIVQALKFGSNPMSLSMQAVMIDDLKNPKVFRPNGGISMSMFGVPFNASADHLPDNYSATPVQSAPQQVPATPQQPATNPMAQPQQTQPQMPTSNQMPQQGQQQPGNIWGPMTNAQAQGQGQQPQNNGQNGGAVDFNSIFGQGQN